MAKRVILDGGNSDFKWFVPSLNAWNYFMHAIVVLSESEWKKAVGASRPPRGLLRVNGVPYAVGNKARRYVLKDRPAGAARYTPEYYGAGLAFALSEAFQQDEDIALYASHAPQDQPYAPMLVEAAKQEWVLETHRGPLRFCVKKVSTYDEPMGVFAHYAFDRTGALRPEVRTDKLTRLIIDAGGHTTDRAIIDPNGEVDQQGFRSYRTGTNAIIQQFEEELRRNNLPLFQEAGDLDIKRLEAALISGVYQYGNSSIPCADEADAAKQVFANDVIGIIKAAGGAANFDEVILGGGGSAMIAQQLATSYKAIDFRPAEPDPVLARFSIAFGGAAIATLRSKAGG